VTFGDVAWAVVETAFGAAGAKVAKGATKAIAATAKKVSGAIRKKFFSAFTKIIKNEGALAAYAQGVKHWKTLKGMTDAAIKKLLREAGEHVGQNMPYSMAKKLTEGFKGLIQAHHIFPTQLLEKLFPKKAADLARGVWAVVLDAAGHQRFTESFAKAISKFAGELEAAAGNPAKLKEVVRKILKTVYKDDKELLEMAETILENLPWSCLG
jgi:hypothetical protein